MIEGIHIQIIGLLIDIFGALIITSPDVPIINKHFRSGRIIHGRHLLETAALSEQMTGYDAILEELETMNGQKIEPHPHVIMLWNDSSSGGIAFRRIYGAFPTKEENSPETRRITDMPYRFFNNHLRSQIRKSESKVRVFGFIVLATGFLIQIFGLI